MSNQICQRHNIIGGSGVVLLILCFLATLVSDSLADNPFIGDPLESESGTLITTTFMQQVYDQNDEHGALHRGVDVNARVGALVYPGIESGSKVQVTDIQTDSGGGTIVFLKWGDGVPNVVLVHLTNVHLSVGDMIAADTQIGQVGGGISEGGISSHLHIEYGTDDSRGFFQYGEVRNPCLEVYQGASWGTDSEQPRLSPDELPDVCCELNSVTDFVFPACDSQGRTLDLLDGNGPQEVLTGIYKAELYIGLNRVKKIQFDRMAGTGNVSDYYDDSSTPNPNGIDNPNTLRYKISYDLRPCQGICQQWTVVLYDCAGNQYGKPTDGTAQRVTYFGGEIADGKAHLRWVLSSTNGLKEQNVWRGRPGSSDVRVNSNPLNFVDELGKQKTDFEFVDFLKDLPEGWDTLWYTIEIISDDHL